MTTNDKVWDEKLQYDINREAVKISALSSGKIDKCEYLTAEDIIPSDKRRVIEQSKFIYSPLQKALEKQTKTIENQGKKQTKTIEDHEKQWLSLMLLLKKMIMILNINYFWRRKNCMTNLLMKRIMK